MVHFKKEERVLAGLSGGLGKGGNHELTRLCTEMLSEELTDVMSIFRDTAGSDGLG